MPIFYYNVYSFIYACPWDLRSIDLECGGNVGGSSSSIPHERQGCMSRLVSTGVPGHADRQDFTRQ